MIFQMKLPNFNPVQKRWGGKDDTPEKNCNGRNRKVHGLLCLSFPGNLIKVK
jgi:hypothetical protein